MNTSQPDTYEVSFQEPLRGMRFGFFETQNFELSAIQKNGGNKRKKLHLVVKGVGEEFNGVGESQPRPFDEMVQIVRDGEAKPINLTMNEQKGGAINMGEVNVIRETLSAPPFTAIFCRTSEKVLEDRTAPTLLLRDDSSSRQPSFSELAEAGMGWLHDRAIAWLPYSDVKNRRSTALWPGRVRHFKTTQDLEGGWHFEWWGDPENPPDYLQIPRLASLRPFEDGFGLGACLYKFVPSSDMEKFKLTMGFILQQRLLEHSKGSYREKFASEKDILLSHIQKHNSKIPVDMAEALFSVAREKCEELIKTNNNDFEQDFYESRRARQDRMTVAEMHSFQIVDEVGDAASPFGEWEPYEEDHCFLFDMYESRKISDSIVIIQKVNIDESTGTKTYTIYHPVNERKYDRVSIDNLRPLSDDVLSQRPRKRIQTTRYDINTSEIAKSRDTQSKGKKAKETKRSTSICRDCQELKQNDRKVTCDSQDCNAEVCFECAGIDALPKGRWMCWLCDGAVCVEEAEEADGEDVVEDLLRVEKRDCSTLIEEEDVMEPMPTDAANAEELDSMVTASSEEMPLSDEVPSASGGEEEEEDRAFEVNANVSEPMAIDCPQIEVQLDVIRKVIEKVESHVGDLEVIISFPSTDDHNNGQIEDELDCCMRKCRSVHKTLRKLLYLVGTEGRGLVSSDLDYFGGAQERLKDELSIWKATMLHRSKMKARVDVIDRSMSEILSALHELSATCIPMPSHNKAQIFDDSKAMYSPTDSSKVESSTTLKILKKRKPNPVEQLRIQRTAQRQRQNALAFQQASLSSSSSATSSSSSSSNESTYFIPQKQPLPTFEVPQYIMPHGSVIGGIGASADEAKVHFFRNEPNRLREPLWDECPHMANYRVKLYKYAINSFHYVYRLEGRCGNPREDLSRAKGREMAEKVYAHWWFMHRSKPTNQITAPMKPFSKESPTHPLARQIDVLAPMDDILLAWKILPASKSVRMTTDDHMEKNQNMLWKEEPPELSSFTGRQDFDPHWTCPTCSSLNFIAQEKCCENTRPAFFGNPHCVWQAAYKVSQAWNAILQELYNKLHQNPCGRYLPSDGSWSDSLVGVHYEVVGGHTIRLSLRGSNDKGVEFKSFKLRRAIYHRLKDVYDQRNFDSAKFNTRVFNMMARYECIMGETGQHGQLTRSTFQFLYDKLKVNTECFASPLNWQTVNFCSAFNDCDYWFGSQGSFFDFMPTEDGSFEVNPPFMIHGCSVEDHLQNIFEQCDNQFALSFVLVYPSSHFLDKAVGNHVLLSRKMGWVKMKIVLVKNHHGYFKGNQHEMVTEHGKVPFVMASHNSTIYILQNIKGSEKYSAWRDDPTFRSSIARVFSEGE